jgi:hypothetical protein
MQIRTLRTIPQVVLNAGSFLTGSLVARQKRLTERMSSQHRSRHMYARRSDFDCT